MRSRNDWGPSDETLLRRWQVKWKAKAGFIFDVWRRAAQALTQPSPGS